MVKLILDISCSQCDEYIDALKFWCSMNDETLSIQHLDDDPAAIWAELKQLRADGHDITYMPVLIVDTLTTIHTYTGILTPQQVSDIFNELY